MSILKRDLSIALLLGGPGAEREVSLVSGSSVYDALVRAGFTNVTRVDLQGPDFRLPEGTELAYNIIHGHLREDGALQSILEERGIPYTGAGSRSSAVCFDKAKSKKIFTAAGVPTPKAEILDCSNGIVMPSLPLPFVIKPPCEGSSVGVHIVHRQEDVLPAMEKAVTHGPEVLVEEFIQGRELTVGILDGEALPVIHICPRSGFYDLSNKYPWMNMGGGTDYICPGGPSGGNRKKSAGSGPSGVPRRWRGNLRPRGRAAPRRGRGPLRAGNQHHSRHDPLQPAPEGRGSRRLVL